MNELAVIVDLFPFYTSMDDYSTQVYLCSLLNRKEGHCEYFVALRVTGVCVVVCSSAL